MNVNKSNFWICGFEYNQYLEFIEYLNTKPKNIYLTFYHCFYNNDNDILFLYCRSVPKKIKGGLFGYCVLKDISKPNNIKVKVFKDDLVNVCYNEIEEIKTLQVEDFLLLEDLFENSNLTTHKSFSIKYIKKFLRMENIPIPLGEFIQTSLDNKFNNLKNIEDKYEEIDEQTELEVESSVESESSNSSDSSDSESIKDSITEYSESDDDKSISTKSDSVDSQEMEEMDEEEKLEEENNKNGLIPIMIELCKKFRFPNLKYDKKKFNSTNNPDILAKLKYFKDHVLSCTNCNITNNNNQQLSYLLNDSKIFYKEHQETKGDLEEGIEKYQSGKKFDAFCFEDDKINIRINHITDERNIYNKCVILFITQKSNN